MKQLISYLAIKPFAGTILESDSSVTESETEAETDTPDSAEFADDVEDSNGECQGNGQGGTTVQKSKTARKQQFDEVCQFRLLYINTTNRSCQQPRWSKQPEVLLVPTTLHMPLMSR